MQKFAAYKKPIRRGDNMRKADKMLLVFIHVHSWFKKKPGNSSPLLPKNVFLKALIVILTLSGTAVHIHAQTARAARVDVLNRDISVTLRPDDNEFAAAVTIKFKVSEQTTYVGFTLSDNLFVRRVFNNEGIEMEFNRNQVGPETLAVRFSPPLPAEEITTLRIEYEGGFSNDRFSRTFSRDITNAYIGMEETRLLESAKWFPAVLFPAERAGGSLEVTVPLGMTVVGPGKQEPVVTKGINETFVWLAGAPLGANAFVAGQYSLKKVQAGGFTIECFFKGETSEAIEKSAAAVGKILAYYRDTYGLTASDTVFRLVEVDDALSRQTGMAGTIFITKREIAEDEPPIRELSRRTAAQWWHENAGVSAAADLWLADGLSYYSSARYLGEQGGEDAFKKEIDALAVLALKFEDKSSVNDGISLGYRSDRYESVVAGKGAWIAHMLHGILGEEKFSYLLKQYYETAAKNGGGSALFQRLTRDIYGRDMNWFFTEWLDTIGVPNMQVDYALYRTAEGFRITGAIRQSNDLFRMPVDIAAISGDREERKTIDVSGKSAAFDFIFFSKPEKVVLDPRNIILRDSEELRTSVQIALGDDMRRSNNFVEAVRAYDEALKLSPRRSLARYKLGETFFEQYNLQSAANAFRETLNGDMDPGWIEVWCYIYLGKIYDILGQRQRAMAEYTRAQNTKDDTNGAQAEAAKWLEAPYMDNRGGEYGDTGRPDTAGE